MKIIYRSAFILFLSLILLGCGFHLRNKHDLPPQLWTLYLKSNRLYGQFESKLRRVLTSIGINFVNSQTQSPYSLQILSTDFSHTIPSISTSNQAQTYTYTYTVNFNIVDRKNKQILPARSVSASGKLILQPNEVLGSTNQAKVLENQLQNKCIDLLYESLTSGDVVSKFR